VNSNIGAPASAASSRPPARTDFRTPIGPRLLTLFGAVVCAGASVLLTGVALLVLFLKQWALVFVVAPLACFMAGLTAYVAKDLRGKRGLRVALEADSLVLDLPDGRSLIHHLPALRMKIPYADIEAIESRLEAYGSLGMEMMQRAYGLRRKNAELIFLFEDRAIGTPFESALFTKLAADIAARAGVPLRELGMVEGGGGVLGVWGTRAADWTAPALSPARQYQMWRRVAMTGALPIPVIVIAFLVRMLIG
jgi:hypothetical protein